MSWSKVTYKGKKPLGWWYHKILCEISYYFFKADNMYYKHLNIMCDRINLYGKARLKE